MDASTLTAALAVGGAVLYWGWRKASSKRLGPGLELPPTAPGSHPLLGHLKTMGRQDVHRPVVEWGDELGPVYRLDMKVAGQWYVISDAAMAAPLMTRGPDYCNKAPVIYNIALPMSFGTPSLFSAVNETPTWHRIRKELSVCFSTKNIKKMFPHMKRHVDKLVDMWARELQATSATSTSPATITTMIDDLMPRCILDIVGSAEYGLEFNSLDNEHHPLLEVIHAVMAEFTQRMVNPLRMPLQKLLPFLPMAVRARGNLRKYEAALVDMMAQIEAKGPPAPDDESIGACLLRLKEPKGDHPGVHPKEVLANMSVMTIGGFDTSSSAACWLLYNVAAHPEVQARCTAELAKAGLLRLEGGPARELTWEDANGLPYLQAVIKESMRYTTTAATGAFRQAHKDLVLGGKWFIPKGSVLWVPFACVHSTHHNYLEAKRFYPERWLQGHPQVPPGQEGERAGSPGPDVKQGADQQPQRPTEPTLTGNGATALKSSYLPFSDGPRSCLGLSMALLNLRVLLMTVLSNYHIEVHPDMGSHQEVMDSQVIMLVMLSGRPTKLVLRRHTPDDLAHAHKAAAAAAAAASQGVANGNGAHA